MHNSVQVRLGSGRGETWMFSRQFFHLSCRFEFATMKCQGESWLEKPEPFLQVPVGLQAAWRQRPEASGLWRPHKGLEKREKAHQAEGRAEVNSGGVNEHRVTRPKMPGVFLELSWSYWMGGVHTRPGRGLCWLFPAPLSPHSPSLDPGPLDHGAGTFSSQRGARTDQRMRGERGWASPLPSPALRSMMSLGSWLFQQLSSWQMAPNVP